MFIAEGSEEAENGKEKKGEEKEIGQKNSNFQRKGIFIFFKEKPQISPAAGQFGQKALYATFKKIEALICKKS